MLDGIHHYYLFFRKKEESQDILPPPSPSFFQKMGNITGQLVASVKSIWKKDSNSSVFGHKEEPVGKEES